MKEKSNLSTIIIAGIMLIAVLVVAKFLFVPENLANQKSITATGTAETTAQPDEADTYLHVEVLRDTADAAASESKDKSNAVIAALKAMDGVKVETTSYYVNKQEDWTQNGPVFKGYDAVYSLKVSTANFSNVGKIIDMAIANGANGVDSVQFVLSKTAEETVRAEVLKQASANAKMKAQSVADGLGVKLGDLISVNENGFNAPPIFYAKATEAVSAGRPVADLAIEPSSIQVSATVSVAYKIR